MTRVAICRLLAGLFAGAAASMAVAGDVGPDWFRRSTQPMADLDMQSTDEVLVVLQRERADGAELLTVRYPFARLGPVSTYAGTGINRTAYFAWSSDPGDVIQTRSRHRSIGAAAELGAEWRVTGSLAVAADLHWMDLASDADLLRGRYGLVAADPLGLGVSLGWRFR